MFEAFSSLRIANKIVWSKLMFVLDFWTYTFVQKTLLHLFQLHSSGSTLTLVSSSSNCNIHLSRRQAKKPEANGHSQVFCQFSAEVLRDVGTLYLAGLQIGHIQTHQGGIVDLLVREFGVADGLVTCPPKRWSGFTPFNRYRSGNCHSKISKRKENMNV